MDFLYDYYVLIPHTTEPHILLLQEEAGWTLPHWTTTQRHFWQESDHINITVRERWQLEAIILRCLLWDTSGHDVRIHELENLDPGWTPPVNGIWISQEELDMLPLVRPEQRTLLQNWFLERLHGLSPRRRAWARQGWFDNRRQWMKKTLEQLDIQVTGPVEQLRTWERSCLLRQATSIGYVYCKAVPPMFAHEPMLTQTLHQWHPAHFPDVLAADHERGYLLMRDFGGPALSQKGTFEQWQKKLRTLAQLQIDLIPRQETLLALGCPYRPLEQLADDIRALLADTEALHIQGKGLTTHEIVQLQAREPEFLAMCKGLATYALPYSLEHGDFSPSNVALVNDAPLFFDWSDSSITHPFFNMMFVPGEIEGYFPGIPEMSRHQQTAYLEPWTRYAPLPQLQRALELAQPLALLHHATRYHRFILPQMEARWEMERMIPAYLRCLFAN